MHATSQDELEAFEKTIIEELRPERIADPRADACGGNPRRAGHTWYCVLCERHGQADWRPKGRRGRV